MTYTIKIQDNSTKAKSIINMLIALRDDYDFIEIQNDENKISEFDEELEKRYNSFQINSKGKDWEDLKKELV